MNVFNAGDRVRVNRYADEVVQAGRLAFPYLATVLTSGVINDVVHIEWDADADGGPYEDEYLADRLVTINDNDIVLLQVARDADRLNGADSTVFTDMLLNRFGDFTEMVNEYITDNELNGYEVEESPDEIEEMLRDGALEIITDDLVLPAGYTLGRNTDGDLAIMNTA